MTDLKDLQVGLVYVCVRKSRSFSVGDYCVLEDDGCLLLMGGWYNPSAIEKIRETEHPKFNLTDKFCYIGEKLDGYTAARNRQSGIYSIMPISSSIDSQIIAHTIEFINKRLAKIKK